MRQIPYENLHDVQKKLLARAESVMKTAYNPYSHFYVGAALENNWKIVTGSNVENAAYGSTICAERSAILRANSMGMRNFGRLAIIARGENFDTTEVTGPCGSCRQMIYELSQVSGKDIEIIMSTTKKDKIIIATIKELLPLAFGPLDLGIDITKYKTN